MAFLLDALVLIVVQGFIWVFILVILFFGGERTFNTAQLTQIEFFFK